MVETFPETAGDPDACVGKQLRRPGNCDPCSLARGDFSLPFRERTHEYLGSLVRAFGKTGARKIPAWLGLRPRKGLPIRSHALIHSGAKFDFIPGLPSKERMPGPLKRCAFFGKILESIIKVHGSILQENAPGKGQREGKALPTAGKDS